MKRFAKLFAVGAIATAMLIPAAAEGSHTWGSYHWERSTDSLQLDVGDNVSSDWDFFLDKAVADWDASAVLELTQVVGSAKGRCKATTGRIEVCNDAYGPNGWLGVATVYTSGDHITAATTKVNDTYFSLPQYNSDVWRQMVMCQEIGHDFGLGHQNEDFSTDVTESCMEYTSEPVGNETPDSHDFEQLAVIYGHSDGGSSGGGGGGGGDKCPPKKPGCPANAELDSPSDWGQLVRSEGRHAIYERDFGNGNRVFTFVTWAG